MSGPVRCFAGADGNRLVADRFGSDGAPVLLLHGGGQTRHAWAGAGQRIAAAGHVAYCLDQRGHGESDWVASGRYAFGDFGRDLVAVAGQITQEHGRPPVLVGASLGGLAGILAEGHQAPGTLAALVLVDITPRVDLDGVSRIVAFMSERMEDGFASVEEAADAIAAYLPHRPRPGSLDGLAKNLRRTPDGRLRWHWDPKFISARHGDGDVSRAMAEDELVSAARRLSLPVLLIRGGRSELVSLAHVEEFRAMVPQARFVDVEAAGHMVAGDRNDVFGEALIGFLRDLSPVHP
ncbi:alpha/beta fold hydrolase [Microvirga tunisiensis]|uniref:Alpha/beta fold hydrolase n=2 Tax=Pannonibacter tanglangensis TaxID=2750084 RepID=A0A7X5J8H8_9HYPH|nr:MULTISPECIES: alpha/beta hydrolase [unclassified Pannonibacter]NBN63631.1 alpha/beta fold hydrolase [Pannonibacter sp. XCT-34]NBN77265.1 alpha/beta fold hydrolase [Pannonibacter sp. XCT-53]